MQEREYFFSFLPPIKPKYYAVKKQLFILCACNQMAGALTGLPLCSKAMRVPNRGFPETSKGTGSLQ